MQKIKTKSLTILLLMAMVLAILPLATASTGFMTINVASPGPSAVGQEVEAGGDVSLDTAGVGWSGGQIIMYFSKDGFSQISTDDFAYSPTLELSNITSGTGGTYTNDLGTWTVANDWINGTIPKDIPGGDYYIKAFDGTATAVAVTDTYITVIASFEVVPTSGPGGRDIELKGYAFGPSAQINFSYYNPITMANVSIANLVDTTTPELGQIVYPMMAPDLMQALPAGDVAEANDVITFYAIEQGTGNDYAATYTEWQRGLMQVNTAMATTGLYGNNTDLTSLLIGIGSDVIVAGKWFHPGEINVTLDGATVLGSTTANQTGFFNTTVTMVDTGVGVHDLIIQDANTVFNVSVTIIPSIVLIPNKGQVGALVTVEGYGFPAATGTTAYNVTITWDVTLFLTSTLTLDNGRFTGTFNVPSDYGGGHVVTATANDTASTTASATFDILPTFWVEPDEFANCVGEVKAMGTGFDPENYYVVNIDNNVLGIANDAIMYMYPSGLVPNGSGYVEVAFVGTGFRPGKHVISIYQGTGGDPTIPPILYTWAYFTVTDEGDVIGDLIKDVNATLYGTILSIDVSADVAIIKSDTTILRTQVSAINAAVIRIENGIATILTDIGLLEADIATLNALIVDISGDLVTIQTDLGIIKAGVAAINPKLVKIEGDIATVQTDIGVLTGAVSSIDTKVDSIDATVDSIEGTVDSIEGTVDSTAGKVATIETDVGTIIVDVGDLQEDVAASSDQVSGLTLPVWIAVAFAAIAAIAAIACVLIVRRKIAG